MTSTAPLPGQTGRARHPVLGDRPLKLGTFSANLSGGCGSTRRRPWASA
jgi:hypothetical protein